MPPFCYDYITNSQEKVYIMFDSEQLRSEVILPALSYLNMYSPDAEELLMFTCAVESNGGTYLKQIKGPALGIFQCEPSTYHDMWRNFIVARSNLMGILHMKFNVTHMPSEQRLCTDLLYAAAMCRIHYLRVKEKLPSGRDTEALYEYYKKYYNTAKGASTKKKSIDAYHRFVGENGFQEKVMLPTS